MIITSRPSPKRRGGGGGAHGVGAGAKRKADGSVSKKEELRLEALQIYDDLTAGISAVKSRFEQERCDKDLLTAMLTKCNRAVAYFTNPKHMDLERALPLQNIHKDVTAMKSFVIASSKKSAATKDFEEVFRLSTERNLKLPSGFTKKHVESQFNALSDTEQFSDSVDALFDAEISAEEAAEIVHAYVIIMVSKCKPQKEPNGKPVRTLLATNRELKSKLDAKIAAKPSHQFKNAASTTSSQMACLQYPGKVSFLRALM